ncbi:MAG: short-chain alcohol dehydrogenase like protein [Deltaproteobacteria bacterium]|nr:short-chain alcohol dehydrogenase like protein [Deltaproteobacteria bacterium]
MTGVVPRYPTAHGLLAGKTVVVTASAGTGIGFATARRCVEEGATVMLSDKHAGRLAEYATQLATVAGRAVPAIACDVTREAEVQALFARAIAEMGRVDILVNNAGRGLTASVVETSDAQWHAVLEVSLTATFRCMRAAMRHMMARGTGAIVNVSSVVAWRAEAGQAAYAAAKAGVLALTRAGAMEAAPYGVRVNAVVPTLAVHENVVKVSSEEYLARMVALQALGRAAEPWEVANVIVFLASDLASYMTGEAVAVSNQHP